VASQIVTPQQVARLGTILAVWAHPDDETFVAGGLLASAIKNGQRVVCITATRGEQGKTSDESRWPHAQMGAIRAKELQAALQELGVAEHHWLPYHDGHCADVDQAEATATISEFIKTYRPDSIITFGPEGLTGHPDHRAVCRWASQGVKAAKSKATIYHVVCEPRQYKEFLMPLNKQVNIFFNIDKPPLVRAANCAIALQLPPEIIEQKRRALAAMPSQMEPVLVAVPPAKFAGTFGQEYFTLVQ